MDLGTKISKYVRWVNSESSTSVDEIEWLVSSLLDTDKREEVKEIIDLVTRQDN